MLFQNPKKESIYFESLTRFRRKKKYIYLFTFEIQWYGIVFHIQSAD